MQITVIGDTTLDLVTNLSKIPTEDTEIQTTFIPKLGGQAAHVALGLHKLGVKTKFITTLWKSMYSDQILKKLKMPMEIQKTKTTNMSIIMATKNTRTILNESASAAKLTYNKKITTPYLLISGFWHLKNLNIIKILKQAKKQGTIIFLDFGHTAKPDLQKFNQAVKLADYIFLNQKELHLYTGNKNIRKIKLPCKVALHLGVNGSGLFENNKRILEKNIKKYSGDTTGAGDFWNAGFIYGIIKNWPSRKTLEFANKYAIKCLKEKVHYL